ncbi:Ars binding protein 1 [Globisporangium polare]
MLDKAVDAVAAAGDTLTTRGSAVTAATAAGVLNSAAAPTTTATPPESAPVAAAASSARTRLRSSNLTHEQKRLICLHAKQNPTLTQAQLGQWAKMRFELASTPSQSSISHTLKRKHNFEHMKSEELASKRMRSVKFPELDAALANWFLHCQARQIKVQGDEIKAKAHLFFEMMGIHTADPPQFSNGWLHSFQSRHGFSRSPSTSSSIGGDIPLITTRSELFAAIEGVAPWDLYWMDETRLLFTMSPDQDAATVDDINTSPPQAYKKVITMALCTNSDGSDMLDPFFVCPGRLENPGSSNFAFQYAYNKNTWMSPTVFREWLLALDWKMHEEDRHIVLLLDIFSSHQVKKLTLKNVSVRFVASSSSLPPPSSSSAAQLFAGDSLFSGVEKAIFTAVKRRYRHVFLDHVLDRRDERQTDIYDVEPLQALQWVIRCWRQVPKALIAQTFASIGIHSESAAAAGDVVEVAQSEEKLDAQILALLKRLKLKSPMTLDDFLCPAAEHVGDDELTNQNFVDSALNAAVSVNVFGSGEDAPRRAPRGRVSSKKAEEQVFAATTALRLARNGVGPAAVSANQQQQWAARVQMSTIASESSLEQQQQHDSSGEAVATTTSATTSAAAMADDEWHAWANSLRIKSSNNDSQALQRVIRLATEMKCEPATLLDLNRMLLEVTQSQALALPPQNPPREESMQQSTGVCRFTFNKHVV